MGGFGDDEIPLLVMLFYLFREIEPRFVYSGSSSIVTFSRRIIYAGDNVRWGVWLGRHIC